MIYDGVLSYLLDIELARWKGAHQAAGEEAEGAGPEHGRAQGGVRLRRGDVRPESRLRRRAHERQRGQDPHRRQPGGGHRLHDGRRHRRRVVSDHAVLVAVRVVHRPDAAAPHRQGDGQGDLRYRPGRRRDRGRRHGHRRQLGWRARDDLYLGPRHLADGRVHRPGLLRGGTCGDLRHPARRAVHGPAHAHRAGRPAVDGSALARRHAAPDAPARRR